MLDQLIFPSEALLVIFAMPKTMLGVCVLDRCLPRIILTKIPPTKRAWPEVEYTRFVETADPHLLLVVDRSFMLPPTKFTRKPHFAKRAIVNRLQAEYSRFEQLFLALVAAKIIVLLEIHVILNVLIQDCSLDPCMATTAAQLEGQGNIPCPLSI
jgi:hypothetical protein